MNPKPDPDVLLAKMRRRFERAQPTGRRAVAPAAGSDRWPALFAVAAIGFALGYWWALH